MVVVAVERLSVMFKLPFTVDKGVVCRVEHTGVVKLVAVVATVDELVEELVQLVDAFTAPVMLPVVLPFIAVVLICVVTMLVVAVSVVLAGIHLLLGSWYCPRRHRNIENVSKL